MADDFPNDRRYTQTDEWVMRDGEEFVSGVTAFAAEQLGDVVYVQLPDVGGRFGQGASFGEIESVKAVSDLYCPLSAEITGRNDDLDANPALVNEDPYGKGWMVRFRPDTPADYDALMDADAYRQTTVERS